MLSPASYDFGSVQLGAGQTAARSFQLFNSGSAPLDVSAISVTGAGADQFTLTGSGSCTGAPVAAAQSCQFSVAFKPSRAGAQRASVEVLSNAASSPDGVSLSGTGLSAPNGTAVRGVAAVAVSNSFTIGRPILNRRKGTARLPVTLPGAGTLIAGGSGTFTLPVAGAGTVTVPVRARGRKRRALQRSGKVALKLTVTFVPRGGQGSTQTVRLRLRKAR
jgi:hypothetical protein